MYFRALIKSSTTFKGFEKNLELNIKHENVFFLNTKG